MSASDLPNVPDVLATAPSETSRIEAHARALGFGRAVDLFPEDVEAAAQRAEAQRARIAAPDDPVCEPWPPMRCPPAT